MVFFCFSYPVLSKQSALFSLYLYSGLTYGAYLVLFLKPDAIGTCMVVVGGFSITVEVYEGEGQLISLIVPNVTPTG